MSWPVACLWSWLQKVVPKFGSHALPKHATHRKLFWVWIVFTRGAFWDHCQQNWIIFTCLTPVEPKNWPQTFSSITTKRYVVDRSNYTFSEETRVICWYGFWQHWTSFWILPLYKLSCDPLASCTGCDPAAIWNGDPGTHTNIMKLSNHLFPFSWVNFGSVQPNTTYFILHLTICRDLLLCQISHTMWPSPRSQTQSEYSGRLSNRAFRRHLCPILSEPDQCYARYRRKIKIKICRGWYFAR